MMEPKNSEAASLSHTIESTPSISKAGESKDSPGNPPGAKRLLLRWNLPDLSLCHPSYARPVDIAVKTPTLQRLAVFFNTPEGLEWRDNNSNALQFPPTNALNYEDSSIIGSSNPTNNPPVAAGPWLGDILVESLISNHPTDSARIRHHTDEASDEGSLANVDAESTLELSEGVYMLVERDLERARWHARRELPIGEKVDLYPNGWSIDMNIYPWNDAFAAHICVLNGFNEGEDLNPDIPKDRSRAREIAHHEGYLARISDFDLKNARYRRSFTYVMTFTGLAGCPAGLDADDFEDQLEAIVSIRIWHQDEGLGPIKRYFGIQRFLDPLIAAYKRIEGFESSPSPEIREMTYAKKLAIKKEKVEGIPSDEDEDMGDFEAGASDEDEEMKDLEIGSND